MLFRKLLGIYEYIYICFIDKTEKYLNLKLYIYLFPTDIFNTLELFPKSISENTFENFYNFKLFKNMLN